ncbi:MAG: hypothetical protein ACM3WP_02175 [Acidobacteriota bacterium]
MASEELGGVFPAVVRRALLAALILVLTGCGGGNSSAGPPPPPATFTLSLNPASVALAQSGTQTVQVQSIPQNGFSGSITITANGLPSGVTISPSSLDLTSGNTGTLTLSATPGAASGSAKVSINGASASQQASATLALDVVQTATPVAMPFTITGGAIVKAFYDESRQLLFATNLLLNEVDVLSGRDLSLQARVPIAQPFGIDQMPDGKTLVVGTMTQSFYTINEDTLTPTRYLAPNFTQLTSTTVLLVPVAMSNGKVLFMSKDISSADIFVYAAQAIIEWDSATGQFSMPFYVPFMSLEIDNLKRSADHNWAAFAADKFYIYSSAQDSLVSSSVPMNNTSGFGVKDVAVNSTGSQYAIVSAYSVSFYDSALNLLGTRSLDRTLGFSFQYWNTQFSSDDTLLYWKLGLGGIGSILDVVNASSFTPVGTVTAQFGTPDLLEPMFLWIDSKQRAFFAVHGAIALLDCSSPRSAKPYFLAPTGPEPSSIPLNQSAAITFTSSGIPLGTSVTFGGQLAPVESNNTSNSPVVVQAPASSVAGPVNLVFTQPDGEAMLELQRFSYGADVAAATSTLVPPIGNPILTLYGFGILNGPSTPPKVPIVSVGGQPVTNMAVNVYADLPQELFLELPNGTPGPADIVVTSNTGTSTLKGGISYIPFAAVIPASGLLQLIYDTHRNLLYALQSTQIQVFDPVSLKWTNTLHPAGSAGMVYVAMAITPDGSQLLVLDSQANTLTVFNPDDPSQSTSTALPTGLSGGQNIATTGTGKAFIGGTHPPLEFDIATHTFKTLSTNTTVELNLFVATGDGTHMAAVTNNSGGTVALWHSSNDSFTSQGLQSSCGIGYCLVWTDVAISPDGNIIAPLAGNQALAGSGVAFFDEQLHFTNRNVYPDLATPDAPAAQGAIFSNSGLTLLTPLVDSIDFFNTQTGTLRGRLLMPSLLPILPGGGGTPGVIALDPNQQTIYAISASGLSVVTLPSVVDQITPPAWPYVAKPATSAPMFSGKRKAGALQ